MKAISLAYMIFQKYDFHKYISAHGQRLFLLGRPQRAKNFVFGLFGGLTNEKPTSDKVVTMLINARHWTRRALLMW